jgi:GDPmannose 4,6-dehydratase
MKRNALITGIAGQDGPYLAEWLLTSDYDEIHGTDKDPIGLAGAESLLKEHIASGRLFLHSADSVDYQGLAKVVARVQPAEIYNLAAQTRVDRSFIEPLATANDVAIGTANLLEAARVKSPDARIFQASSSEMYGNAPAPQDEHSAFAPVSPYACAKVYAHQLAAMYRRSYGMYVCSGIMFNHESPRRSPDFVTRKITSGIAKIMAGEIETIRLGNLSARRDWGHARDYVQAMWLMLQQQQASDFVIATGVSHTVAEFVEIAFGLVDLNWRDHIIEDPSFVRPADPSHLQGDAIRASQELGWRPTVVLKDLVYEMLVHDLEARKIDGVLRSHT